MAYFIKEVSYTAQNDMEEDKQIDEAINNDKVSKAIQVYILDGDVSDINIDKATSYNITILAIR